MHYWTNELAKLYREQFDVKFPSLNHPPILWKYVNTLAFPIETYVIAMRVAGLLKMDEFRLADQEKNWAKKGGPPESRLMALLIVACKLGYDIENMAEWKEWAKPTQEELNKDHEAENDDLDEKDILEMSDEKLDRYLDWVQTTWIDEDDENLRGRSFSSQLTADEKGRIPREILNMFPLEPVKSQRTVPSPPSLSSNLFAAILPKSGPHTENYTIYPTSATPPPILNRITLRAATTIGIDVNTLRYSIRWIESNLNRWRVNVGSDLRS